MSGPDWQISPHDMPLSSYDVLKHQTVQAMFLLPSLNGFVHGKGEQETFV